MLSHRDLMQLAATFEDRQVLTVYLHTAVDNPADRHRWEAELDHALRALRDRTAAAPHVEREALDAAIVALRGWLADRRGTLRAPGILAIVEDGEVRVSVAIDAVVPNVATWQRGILLAPLLREVSLGVPAAVLVVDARHVQLFRFTPPRQLELLDTLEATHDFDVERHLGSGNAKFHAGTRGGTSEEALERQQAAARDRLLSDAIRRALPVAGRDGWLVLAGHERAVHAARAMVPDALATRALVVDGLTAHASPAEIAQAVGEAVMARADARDAELVHGIIDEHGSRGRAVAGLRATRAMLDREGVADLILSEHFIDLYPSDADELLRHAFHQGALVREVHGRAAEEIDQRAEGVVARLRYAMPAPHA